VSAGAKAPDDPPQGGRPHEYFSVRLPLSDKVEVFTDPELAGAAFFRADPTERPSVAHIVGNTSRTMALTQIHGQHPNGEHRNFKALPDSHPPDAMFRKGFMDALENSLTERLERMAEGKVATRAASTDLRLIDDLEAFAYRSPEKAASLWAGHSNERPTGPVLKAAVDALVVARASDASAEQTVKGEVARSDRRLSEKMHDSDQAKITRTSGDWER
jgi:hypothetical protein